MSAFHNQFQPDPEMGEDFSDTIRLWQTEKPILQDIVVTYAPPYPEYPKLRSPRRASNNPSCPSARETSDRLEVRIYNNNDNGFGEYQEIAWNFLLANGAAIEADLRRKLFAQHLKSHKQFLEEILPGNRKVKNYWTKIEDSRDWHDPSAVDHLYKLIGIGLMDDGLDECGFSTFDFQSGWDRDHGISILMHKTNVLAAAGMSEFNTDSSSGLIAGVKYIQEYDLDDGDLSLLDT